MGQYFSSDEKSAVKRQLAKYDKALQDIIKQTMERQEKEKIRRENEGRNLQSNSTLSRLKCKSER
ncbi:hypothetical protein A5844_002721 [Enterococcus sp. 10A9_DIV0425]|uniref:Uncharacterized protein n=1 Tax=Candidatus Enterococcus wittei TaxID=1987383 RepID=A0A242JVM7_9ENTE|nr:hypothetical protein [Enterococcus sp. 10A9_DIV0425]OTP06748.1 hypothetical protein A5844_002721 [Enterococcus sp. 10A9_DIV0425]THE15637.1 hypothetical protein E1H99_02330 [Enterococcus hirae]